MPTVEVLTLRSQNRATLARQMLLVREKATLTQVVEALMGMQAQWPKPPFVGVWTRLPDFRREQLVQALVGRDLVRGTMMRGTIHLVSKQDYLRFRAVIDPVLTRGWRGVLRDRASSLDVDDVLAKARAFFDQEPRTFTELRDHLMKQDPTGDERAMGYTARLLLRLVMVPNGSKWGYPGNADFALADSYLGASVEEQAAPDALILRYLAALGPATVADAQNWSGLQGLASAFERLRPQLVTFRDARKRELFDLPHAPRPEEDRLAPARFLPDFDNLLLGHADRSRFVAAEHRPFIYGGGNLRVRSVFLVDGMAAGLWDVERKKSTATMVLQSFAKLANKTRTELEKEASALVRFLEEDATTFDIRLQPL